MERYTPSTQVLIKKIDKIDLKAKSIPRGKEGHYILMKYSIQEEDFIPEKVNLGQRSEGGGGENHVDFWSKSFLGFLLWKSLPSPYIWKLLNTSGKP